MALRRCAGLQVMLDETPRFDVADVFGGGDGLDRRPRWLAVSPMQPEPREVTLAQLAVLAAIRGDTAYDRAALEAAHGQPAIAALQAAGWLVEASDARLAPLDDAGDVAWWAPALLAQLAGRWHGVDVADRLDLGLMPDVSALVEANGPAPTHAPRRRPDAPWLPLAPQAHGTFDELLARRRTCRNFDPAAAVSAADLSRMLRRVWGASGTRELSPGAVAVKKTSPAGGGLHATEAYLLVQRAEGLAPGMYHYLPLQHALEPMHALSSDAARATAHRVLAGQHWFVDVPVLVIMTARFDRLFWKYRQHAKAWRVLHLDVGHLSQTTYLSAADLGLGAFVTAAINDGDVESLLELSPAREAAIAVVGFGPRTDDTRNIELDGLVPPPCVQPASS